MESIEPVKSPEPSGNEAPSPHSREWYQRLTTSTGQYRYPWNQTLCAPGGEDWYSHLLQSVIQPHMRVLEAGCAHGPDAMRFGSLASSWTGYDWMEDFLVQARANFPQGKFVCWDGKSEMPAELQGGHDLLVSRRGPSSFLNHLSSLAAPGAVLLCIYPAEEIRTKVLQKLEQAHAEVQGEWTFRTRGHLPTFADFLLHQQWRGDSRTEAEQLEAWKQETTPAGFPFIEERYIVQARIR